MATLKDIAKLLADVSIATVSPSTKMKPSVNTGRNQAPYFNWGR